MTEKIPRISKNRGQLQKVEEKGQTTVYSLTGDQLIQRFLQVKPLTFKEIKEKLHEELGEKMYRSEKSIWLILEKLEDNKIVKRTKVKGKSLTFELSNMSQFDEKFLGFMYRDLFFGNFPKKPVKTKNIVDAIGYYVLRTYHDANLKFENKKGRNAFLNTALNLNGIIAKKGNAISNIHSFDDDLPRISKGLKGYEDIHAAFETFVKDFINSNDFSELKERYSKNIESGFIE